MISYNEALHRYNNAYEPPRSKKWKAMLDNARPLRRVGETHYGIHKRDDGTIYFRLYDTDVATFYPPNEQGEYKIDVNYYNSITTNKFMWLYGLHYYSLQLPDEIYVRVPYVSKFYANKQGKPCSASLVFNAEGKLLVDKSWHADIYTKVSTAEDKAQRKDYRKRLDVILTLAQFRLPEYLANVNIDSDLGIPFGSGWANVRGNREFEMVKCDPVESDMFIEAVMELGQGVVDVLASKRAYNAGAIKWFHRYGKTQAEVDAFIAERDARYKTIVDAVTPEDFRKSLQARILRSLGIQTGTASKAWGQFRKTVPHQYHVEPTNLLK